MTTVRFEEARAADDPELRRLMARNEMPGTISLSFQREPSYFFATGLQGDDAQVTVARDPADGEIIGVATRALRSAYLNGEVRPLGYLSDLRLERRHRGGTLLARGYRYLRRLHDAGGAPFYFTVIAEANRHALSLLPSRRAGLPVYRDLGRVCSHAINLGRPRREPIGDWQIRRGTADDAEAIADCLARNHSRRQLAPVVTAEELRTGRWRDLRPDCFYLGIRGGRVVGVAAAWDQSAFKQTVVTRYRGALRLLKPWIDAAAPLLGTGRLPTPGLPLRSFYAGLIAVDHDDLTLLRALLLRMHNDACGSGYRYFLLGLHERDPLASVYRFFRVTRFSGRLFAVHWEDGATAVEALDDRPPYVELGML